MVTQEEISVVVITFALHAKGHGFEPRILYTLFNIFFNFIHLSFYHTNQNNFIEIQIYNINLK